MWGEILTNREVEYCQTVLDRLADVEWVAPLVAGIPSVHELSYVHKPLLFELRFAAALHDRGLSAKYEAPANVDRTTVDFEVTIEGVRWRFELVSIQTSDALRAASWEDGFIFGASLASGREDPRQSVEGELLLTQQKVGEKAYDGLRPVKFPVPGPNDRHVIVVDTRGVGITGADRQDCLEICYGHDGVRTPFAHYWRLQDGRQVPIKGLYDPKNTQQRASLTIQERIHAIAFSNDQEYRDGTLISRLIVCENPKLFSSHQIALTALNCGLYQPSQVATAPSSMRPDP